MEIIEKLRTVGGSAYCSKMLIVRAEEYGALRSCFRYITFVEARIAITREVNDGIKEEKHDKRL